MYRNVNIIYIPCYHYETLWAYHYFCLCEANSRTNATVNIGF